MTTIEVKNGSGWNRYDALKKLKFPAGLRAILKSNEISRLEISPADGERPLGIAARYYDADGDLRFTQYFDPHDSVDNIRLKVSKLLDEGITERISRRAREIARANFIEKIRAWRQPVVIRKTNRLTIRVGQLVNKIGRGKFHSKREAKTALYTMVPLRGGLTEVAARRVLEIS